MTRLTFGVSAILMGGALAACIVLGLQMQSAAAKPAPSAAAAAQVAPQVPGAGKAAELASAVQIEPDALAKILQGSKGEKPVVLHVGFKNFYAQAHIPGSDYAGPGSTPEGLELLRQRVSSLQRKQLIVLYCGCCPWDKCPNIQPAFDSLKQMGFTRVKALYIADNFKANWVDKGYPVE